ncbi:MAG: hypothetical protein OXC02_06845 [Rhodobacteraceae bacterium]|nr:hypothetical protein [Paracoccaceae bacterium]
MTTSTKAKENVREKMLEEAFSQPGVYDVINAYLGAHERERIQKSFSPTDTNDDVNKTPV